MERTLHALRRELQSRGGSRSSAVDAGAGTHEDELLSASEEDSDPSPEVHTRALTGKPVFLGSNSGPAMAMALSRSDDQSDTVRRILDKDILPMFTLENEIATYPFVDLLGLPHGSPERLTQWESPHQSSEANMPYAECMLRLYTIALKTVGGRAAAPSNHRVVREIAKRRQEISAIDEQGHSHLRIYR